MKTRNVKVLEKKEREIRKELRKDPHNRTLNRKLKAIEKSLGM